MTKNKIINLIFIPLFLIYLLLLFNINNIFKEEAIYVYKWYVSLLLIGIPFIPVTNYIFRNFKDKGYFFSKTLSIASTSILFFWLSSFKILKFTSINCIITLLLIIGIIILFSKLFKYKYNELNRNNILFIFIEEIFFLLIFMFLMYIKAFRPEAYGTEKFMDYGFMTSMMTTNYFPVEDFWMSGKNLNYYYLGQYIATFLTKISFNKVEYGYNLMLMTICALSCIMSFSITYNLLERLLIKHNIKFTKLTSTIGGMFSAIAINFMGNFHYVLYNLLYPYLEKKYKVNYSGEVDNYWFPDSTRFIGYNPDLPDKTIHEFPSYSYILGDLHAHVLNIIFVITIIGISVSFAINESNKKEYLYKSNMTPSLSNIDWKSWIKTILSPEMILVGFLIGLFQGTNYWDFPIYFIVAGAIILFTNYKKYGFSFTATIFTFLEGAIILLIATITILPFKIHFIPMESGIKFTDRHTLAFQWLILWAFPVITSLFVILFTFLDYRKDLFLQKKSKKKQTKKSIIKQKTDKIKLIREFFDKVDISDLIAATIACCAIGLLLVPEVIYVKDIYGDVYQRSNTMFKTTYQSFIMFGFIIGYVTIKLITIYSNIFKKFISLLIMMSTLLCTGFFITSTEQWFGNIKDQNRYQTLNAANYLETYDEFKYDKLFIEYINENIKEKSVILEAPGKSYTAYNRISVSTGNPTLLGWHTHEWLWRNSLDDVNERSNDINKIYRGESVSEIAAIIDKYNISYIYVGMLEYEKYEEQYVSKSIELLKKICDIEKIITKDETGKYDLVLFKVNEEKINKILPNRN